MNPAFSPVFAYSITRRNEAHCVDVQYQQMLNLDQKTTPPYFSQYALTILIRIMDRHLSTGIELGVFHGPQDISFAVWYRDFLLSALLNSLSAMRRAKATAKSSAATSQAQSHSKGGKRKNSSKAKSKVAAQQQRKEAAADKENEFEMISISLQRELCRGLKRYIAALQQAKILKIPQFEFTSPERVFEERFEVFSLVQQPPQLTYEDYVQGSDYSQVTPHDLLNYAAECIQSSRKAVEVLLRDFLPVVEHPTSYAPLQESELRSLLKVCVGNSVYLHKLRSIVPEPSPGTGATMVADRETKVSLEFEKHALFCTVKLS